jgi:hypothetical protein
MTSILNRGAALVAILLVASGCSGDDPASEPVAGALRVVLTSPNTDDGAVMFQVIGVVDSVVAPAGLTLYQGQPGPNAIRAIVNGNISSGSHLVTLYVADVSKASSIATQVLQVSARSTYAQRPAGAYSLTVQR